MVEGPTRRLAEGTGRLTRTPGRTLAHWGRGQTALIAALALCTGYSPAHLSDESSVSDSSEIPSVTGDTVLEASFDPRIASHGRWIVSLFLLITVVGVLLIPFWLPFSRWYYPEYLRRLSMRLTTQAVEIRKGVFFRKEITIPLNRITDVRLHDGPLMRWYGLRGLRVETAGQAGQNAGSEGDLIGIIDAPEVRNAILRQRQDVLGGESPPASAPAPTPTSDAELLGEIRDILARIEGKLQAGDS